MNRTPRGLLMTLVAVAIGAAGPAGAASIFDDLEAASIFRLDPSARNRAMGGASGAVFWGDVDGWSNPALLGLARGLRYDYDNTKFGNGVYYKARRSVLGWGGLGLALAGRPFTGMGGTRFTLNFTTQGFGVFTDLDEQVKSWSVGASVSDIASSIARMRGGQPPAFIRLADLALGFGSKDLRRDGVVLLGDAAGPAIDWGLLVRTGSAFTAFANPCRVDLAYGYSVQNANEVHVSGLGTVRRPHRHGTAVRLSIDPPTWSTRRAALGLQPLLSLGGAWDRVFVTANDRRVSEETRLGAEIGLANVAYVRFGQGPRATVSASGYGFTLPIGGLAGVRYDRAWIGLDDDPPTMRTDRWSVWLDPLAIAGAWR